MACPEAGKFLGGFGCTLIGLGSFNDKNKASCIIEVVLVVDVPPDQLKHMELGCR